MPSHPAPKVLVCGSLAIDHILKYKGSFADYQEKYQIQSLNISLQLTDYHTCFGNYNDNLCESMQTRLKISQPIPGGKKQNLLEYYSKIHLTKLSHDRPRNHVCSFNAQREQCSQSFQLRNHSVFLVGSCLPSHFLRNFAPQKSQ